MTTSTPSLHTEEKFERTMKTRHLIFMSLGGVIGTGLFFNTAYVIGTTGAFGTILSYFLGALVVYLVMLSLGELSTAMPTSGSFHVYTSRFISPRMGFTVAWLYWLTCTVAVGTSLTGAALSMQYWFPDIATWIWCLIFCFLILGMNVFTTKLFAESEFFLSLVKVLTIVVFIILGFGAIFGIVPMEGASGPIGFDNITSQGLLPHGILPLLTTMIAVNFAFSGTELIAVAAGETQNPEKAIPMAIKTTVFRLIFFFIGTIVVLAALISPEEASILKSPFLTIFERMGIPYAADIFNFIILSALVSAANSNLFASGRMLYSLAQDKTLPKCVTRVNKNGIPVIALVLSMAGGWATLATSVFAADSVFMFLTALCGFSVVVVWMTISLAQINFRKAWLASGKSADELPYRTPGFPYVPYAAIALCTLACVGLMFDPEQRIALYCGIPFTLLCFWLYPRIKRNVGEEVKID